MYNTWVQAQAAAGHADIQAYSHTFRMLGSTEAVDARDNTATTGTGVPTYWLGGAKVADDYADFYDGSWDEEVAGRRETGATVTIGSSWEIWTGSAANGTEQINTDTTSRALGNAGNHWVGLGRPNSSTASHGPISGSTAARTGNKGVYALSGVFTVATPVVTPPVVTTGTEIWSATLTVGSRSFTPSITLLGWNDNGDYTGASLSDADFTFGGDTYEISMVQLVGTALTLGFATSHSGDIATKAIRDKLTLHVGSDSFNLGAGTLASNQHAITLTGASLSWSADESVALKITDDSTPVTTTAPTVTAVELTTTTTYAIGDEVEATVTFSAAVDITGTPRLELDFAGTAKPAACGAATNTTTMVCRYEVVADDSAPNGIAIAANKLTLTGGTITTTGSPTITADLAHAAVAIDAGHKVDGIRPTLVTAGTDAPTTSADGTQVILTFSETIGSVDRTRITIMAGTTTLTTTAASATGTKVEVVLTTALTATITNLTVALGADAIEDAAGNGNFAVQAAAVTNAVVTVTTTAPTVTAVDLTSTATTTTYAIGDEVEATVTFSEAVDITGTPQLELDFAGTPTPATCGAATNTTTMVCSYEVVENDSAPNGIAIAANKLTLNGGTIYATGSTTITADLAHVAVAIDAAHKVDGIRPTLVTTGAEAPTTSADGTKVILTFSETIGSVDRTRITIMAGTTTLTTTAASATGTKVEVVLTTALTATTTNLTVALSADAVEDGSSNGNLAVSATAVTNAVVAVVTTPTVAAVDLTSTATTTTYAIGDEVEATVTFSAGVDITGTPQLELDFAGTAKAAACTAATTTTTMVCSYEVVAGDVAASGIAIAANKLTGGTITATGSPTINAVLAHAAVAIDAGHKVDGIRPTLDSATVAADGASIDLVFDEELDADAFLSFDSSAFGVTADGNAVTFSVGLVSSGDRAHRIVRLSNPSPVIAADQAVIVSYTDPTTGDDTAVLQDAAANDVASFTTGSAGAPVVTNTAIVPNAPPAFEAASTTREVAENSAAGTNVGDPVTATDADSGDTLTYTLDGTDAASFDIVSTSGQIRTKSGVTYDYETKSSYALIVKAEDRNGGSDTIAVTITVTDVEDSPAVRAWLGRFGRTVSGQVLDAVEERLRATRAAGVSVRVAGQSIDLATKADAKAAPEDEAEKERRARLAARSGWLGEETEDGKRAGMQSRTPTGPEAMMGSSFALGAKTDGGGSSAVWGRMAQSRFSGREGGLSLDGDVTTGLLGAEYARGPLAGGAVLSNSRGEGGHGGDAAGRVEASMTALTPWAGYKVSERLSVWGALGYGAGELTLTPKAQPGQNTDLAMRLAAGGARGTVVDGDGPKLDAVADARWVRTTSEKVSSSDGYLAAASADVTRLRLGLEGSWAMALDDQGATVTPRVSFGVRHDGGDAETGFGADIGGGVILAMPARGFSVSLEGRGLLTHEAKGLGDTGFGASVAWDQAPSSKRGLSLTLRHSAGGPATGGTEALFSREVMDGLAANGNQRLEGRVGYGLAVYGDRFTGTPELGYGRSDRGRDLSLGWRLTREGREAGSFEASLETTRRETANDNDPEHGIGFRLTARW